MAQMQASGMGGMGEMNGAGGEEGEEGDAPEEDDDDDEGVSFTALANDDDIDSSIVIVASPS
jgi:hypothetical protein